MFFCNNGDAWGRSLACCGVLLTVSGDVVLWQRMSTSGVNASDALQYWDKLKGVTIERSSVRIIIGSPTLCECVVSICPGLLAAPLSVNVLSVSVLVCWQHHSL
jgi:hypothetical protein